MKPGNNEYTELKIELIKECIGKCPDAKPCGLQESLMDCFVVYEIENKNWLVLEYNNPDNSSYSIGRQIS